MLLNKCLNLSSAYGTAFHKPPVTSCLTLGLMPHSPRVSYSWPDATLTRMCLVGVCPRVSSQWGTHPLASPSPDFCFRESWPPNSDSPSYRSLNSSNRWNPTWLHFSPWCKFPHSKDLHLLMDLFFSDYVFGWNLSFFLTILFALCSLNNLLAYWSLTRNHLPNTSFVLL